MMKTGKKDLRQRVAHLLNEIRLFKGINFDAFGPLTTIQYYRSPIVVPRDELLRRKAITDDCLHDFEKGYEHLPEVNSPAIVAAQKRLDEEYGDEWWDDVGGTAARQELQRLIDQAEVDQFTSSFLPSLPPEVQQQRTALISSIQMTLEQCRRCGSWEEKSEYKLPQWLDHVEESMIPYTSLPNLRRIKESVTQYLEIHLAIDNGLPHPFQDKDNESSLVGRRNGDESFTDLQHLELCNTAILGDFGER